MAAWTLHLPPDDPPRPPVLVREGFAWWALVLPLPWLLWHRLWLPALGWCGAAAGLALLAPRLGGVAVGAIGAAAQLLFAWHARDLRRWRLARRGWREHAVVLAPTEGDALARLAERDPALRPLLLRAALA